MKKSIEKNYIKKIEGRKFFIQIIKNKEKRKKQPGGGRRHLLPTAGLLRRLRSSPPPPSPARCAGRPGAELPRAAADPLGGAASPQIRPRPAAPPPHRQPTGGDAKARRRRRGSHRLPSASCAAPPRRAARLASAPLRRRPPPPSSRATPPSHRPRRRRTVPLGCRGARGRVGGGREKKGEWERKEGNVFRGARGRSGGASVWIGSTVRSRSYGRLQFHYCGHDRDYGSGYCNCNNVCPPHSVLSVEVGGEANE